MREEVAGVLDVENSADAFKFMLVLEFRNCTVNGLWNLPIGPKYPINKASFQSLTQLGMSLYVMKIAGIRLNSSTNTPSPISRATVMPVTSGNWNSLQGMMVPMYMKPPK